MWTSSVGLLAVARALVEVDRIRDRPIEDQFALLQHKSSIADGLGGARGVRHEDDGDVFLLHDLANLAVALLAECLVANAQRLVDDEDLGVDVRADREPDARLHSARVGTHRLIDVVADVGELHDLLLELDDLVLLKAPDLSAQVYVLAARELGVEPCRELEQRAHTTVDDDFAFGREDDTGDHLEHRGLASTVLAHDSDRLASTDDEVEVPVRVDLLERDLVREDAEESVLVASVQLVLLRHAFELDGDLIGSHMRLATARPRFRGAACCRCRCSPQTSRASPGRMRPTRRHLRRTTSCR